MTTQNNRRRWMLIGGLIALVIAVSGLFVASRINTVMTTFFNRTDDPVSVAAHYYEAIQNQNYATAYADLDNQVTLDGQTLDEQSFVKLAQAADAQQGPLFTYGLLRQPGNGTQFNASLRRGDQAYTVHIQLQPVGNRWKIVSMDGL